MFGNEVGEEITPSTYRAIWNATCEAAGIPKAEGSDTRFALHFHDLRREFGSLLSESGASLHVVRDMLGHANLSTTDAYLSTTSASRQRAMKQCEQYRLEKQKRRQREEQKRKRTAARRVRTSFAQTPANDPPADGFLSAKNPANLLN